MLNTNGDLDIQYDASLFWSDGIFFSQQASILQAYSSPGSVLVHLKRALDPEYHCISVRDFLSKMYFMS